jgi:uncharacterized protein YacL
MAKRRLPIPISLLISIVVFLVLGLVSGPFIRSVTTPQQMATNVLLDAIPFLLIFIAIILAFIALIVMMANLLNGNISPRIYRPVETVLIGGIVLGIIGMFQPWLFAAYRWGFILLLVSTLGYILWSHISPKGAAQAEEAGPLPIEEG